MNRCTFCINLVLWHHSKLIILSWVIFKKNECNSIETITNTHLNLNEIPLSVQTKFRLNEINRRKDLSKKERQWVKNWVNTLILLIISTRPEFLYLQ